MYPYLHILPKPVSTYSVCMLIGFYLVAILSIIRARKQNVRPEYIIVLAIFVFLGAIVGAALLYIFVTYPINEIIPRLLSGNLSVGLVFYGGLIGGIGAAFLGAKICRVKLSDYESSIVPFIPLGHGIGRIGCLMAGCCYGIEYSGFGAIYYNIPEYGLYPNVGYFPVQPMEAFMDICIMVYLLYASNKELPKYDLLFRYLFLYAIMRFITELFRGDEIRGINILSTSQWISVALVIIFVVRLIYKKRKEKKIS